MQNNKNQNLEEKTNFLDEEEKRTLKDFLQIGACALGIGFLATQFRFENLIGKIGLIGKEPLSNGLLLAGIYGNTVAGAFSSFTNRYLASSIWYISGVLPDLYDIYKEGDFSLSMKRFAFKTVVIYSSWALGVVGKKAYKRVKDAYKKIKITPL